MNQHKCC